MSAATDCPACPDCSAHCGTATDYEGYTMPRGRLRCAACGHEWKATASEVEQATRADAAWEAQQRENPEVRP